MVIQTENEKKRFCGLCGEATEVKLYIAFHGRLDKRELRIDCCQSCYDKHYKKFKVKRIYILKKLQQALENLEIK